MNSLAVRCVAAAADDDPAFGGPEQQQERERRLAWFREAKSGLFNHWGLYALPAGRWKGTDYPWIGEWIMRWAKIPAREYETLAKDFNPPPSTRRRSPPSRNITASRCSCLRRSRAQIRLRRRPEPVAMRSSNRAFGATAKATLAETGGVFRWADLGVLDIGTTGLQETPLSFPAPVRAAALRVRALKLTRQ